MVKLLLVVAALLAVGTSCGGIAATQSVSPLMFLLPGLAQDKPVQLQHPAPVQTETNLTVALVD
jgi:hypothetical protein